MADEASVEFTAFEEETLRVQGHLWPDWFLGHFVSMANDSGVSVGITLFVNGLIVSGATISGADYFKAIGDQVRGAIGVSEEESEGNLFQPYIDDYTRDREEDEAPLTLTYVHLKDAQVWAPGQPMAPKGGMFWRGRLSSVDGFTLGSWSIGRS